jgi:hypothetical protein
MRRVFTYRCPGCGKQHVADKEPEQSFTATCLRCQGAIRVPGAAPRDTPVQVQAEKTAVATRDRETKETEGATRLKGAITRQPARKKAPPGRHAGREAAIQTQRAGARRPADKKVPPAGPDEIEGAEVGDPPTETPKESPSRDDPKAHPKAHPKADPKLASKPPQDRVWNKRIILAIVLGFVLVGGGVYVLFGSSLALMFAGKKDTPKTSPKTASKKPAKDKPPPNPSKPAKDKPSKSVEPTKDAKSLDKPKPPEPVFKPTNNTLFRLSAARLSAELAEDEAVAHRKYHGALLEVTGAFAKVETRASVKPPGRPHYLFATDGPALRCDPLGGATPPNRWKALREGQIFTVRGAYRSDGYLHGCELLPPAPPADAKYKDKEVEIVGIVGAVSLNGLGLGTDNFPTIQLEHPTDTTAVLVCLFRAADAEVVGKARPGDPVTIRGKCSGRRSELKHVVRVDNCQLVDTTAPTPPTVRLDLASLLWEYEEDLLPGLRPQPGKEERVKDPLTVRQLADQAAAGGKLLEDYRHKLLTFKSGTVKLRTPYRREVELVSGDTDTPFKIRCRFTPSHFDEVGDRKTLTVRGVCTAMPDASTLQLDNCEVFDPARTDERRLTASFLPHTPGLNQTYDVAVFGADDTARLVRQLHSQRAGGVTEVKTTHVYLSPKFTSVFSPGVQEKWLGYKRTRRVPQPITETVLSRRLSSKFVEVRERIQDKEETETAWQPVLKLRAREGDSWTWSYKNVEHGFKLVKFGRHQGRTSAEITESYQPTGSLYRVEIRRVYVEGVGEVERRDLLVFNNRERRTVAEKRLVEDSAPPTAKDPPVPKKDSVPKKDPKS